VINGRVVASKQRIRMITLSRKYERVHCGGWMWRVTTI